MKFIGKIEIRLKIVMYRYCVLWYLGILSGNCSSHMLDLEIGMSMSKYFPNKRIFLGWNGYLDFKVVKTYLRLNLAFLT